MRESFAGKFVP